jgi:hypothetical protein
MPMDWQKCLPTFLEAVPMPKYPERLSGAGRRSIPLFVKVFYTLFVAALVPYYWHVYGPANFLWFCDIALLVTVATVWLENRFLASMQLVGTFLIQLVWLADLLTRLLGGFFLVHMTDYMFRPDIPLPARLFSLYHGGMPFLLGWLVWRLGYARRAWLAQTVLAWVVLPVCYLCTDPRRTLNAVFGPSGEKQQDWMAPELYLLLLMVFYPVCIFFPSHLLFCWVFRAKTSHSGEW